MNYVEVQIGLVVMTEALVVENQTSRRFVNTADEKSADLIVVGTHGRNGFNRVMLGLVTERVLRETNRPVLTVRSMVALSVP